MRRQDEIWTLCCRLKPHLLSLAEGFQVTCDEPLHPDVCMCLCRMPDSAPVLWTCRPSMCLPVLAAQVPAACLVAPMAQPAFHVYDDVEYDSSSDDGDE